MDTVIQQRIEDAIKKGEHNLDSHLKPGGMRGLYVESGAHYEWHTQALTLLITVFGERHTYAETFAKRADDRSDYTVRAGLGVLRAALQDVCAGYLWTIQDLVHAELFDNLLEQAEQLVTSGYKDAAAVIAGGTLEEHLRALCSRNAIPTTTPDRKGNPEQKSASRMNEDLAKHPVYNQIESKSVTGWQAIRNDAAHGKYTNYKQEQVEQMIEGIRSFMLRHPA